MQCGYCETENPENAVFCKKCGRQLDGMAVCCACGELTPADGEFCIHCGSNRNAPVCLMPVRFAPREQEVQAATDVHPAARPAVKPGRASVKNADAEGVSKAKGILGTVSVACAAASALIGMIFVFLIGCVQFVSAGSATVGNMDGYGLFYFFGDAYDVSVTGGGSAANSAIESGAAFGTICAVLALAGVALCFIMTAVRAVAAFRGNDGKSLFGWAAATYFAYVCGVALYMLCMVQKAEAASVTTGITAAPATIAGLVLGAIFLIASLVLREIARSERADIRTYIFRIVGGILPFIFGCVAVGMIGSCAVSVTADTSAISGSTTYGIFGFFVQLATLSVDSSRSFRSFYTENTAAIIVLFIFAIAVCVFLTVAALRYFGDIGERTNKSTRVLLVMAGLFSVGAGIMMLVSSYIYAVWLGRPYYVDAGIPAAAIVFGALICVCNIVYAIVERKVCAPFASHAIAEDRKPFDRDATDPDDDTRE